MLDEEVRGCSRCSSSVGLCRTLEFFQSKFQWRESVKLQHTDTANTIVCFVATLWPQFGKETHGFNGQVSIYFWSCVQPPPKKNNLKQTNNQKKQQHRDTCIVMGSWTFLGKQPSNIFFFISRFTFQGYCNIKHQTPKDSSLHWLTNLVRRASLNILKSGHVFERAHPALIKYLTWSTYIWRNKKRIHLSARVRLSEVSEANCKMFICFTHELRFFLKLSAVVMIALMSCVANQKRWPCDQRYLLIQNIQKTGPQKQSSFRRIWVRVSTR